jgi:hypothetical protein
LHEFRIWTVHGIGGFLLLDGCAARGSKLCKGLAAESLLFGLLVGEGAGTVSGQRSDDSSGSAALR